MTGKGTRGYCNTSPGEIYNYEESNRCCCTNGYLSSTPKFNFISTFCFLYFVSCCFHLSLGPTASLPSISKSFAGTSKDNRNCNLVISSVVHRVHVGTLSGNTAKKVEEKIGANGRQNGNQEVIMHSMSTPALSLNGSLLSNKVSSISKKVKDALGKVIPGNAVLTR